MSDEQVRLEPGDWICESVVSVKREEAISLKPAPHPSYSLHWIGTLPDGSTRGFDSSGKSMMGAHRIVRRAEPVHPQPDAEPLTDAPDPAPSYADLLSALSQSQARVAELEGAIEKHRADFLENGEAEVPQDQKLWSVLSQPQAEET